MTAEHVANHAADDCTVQAATDKKSAGSADNAHAQFYCHCPRRTPVVDMRLATVAVGRASECESCIENFW